MLFKHCQNPEFYEYIVNKMNLSETLSQTKENFIDFILIHNEKETLLRYLFDIGWISKHYDDEMLLIAG